MATTTIGHKPAGGFVLVSDDQLTRAWGAYRDGLIRLADLRAYLACLEMRARRCFGPAKYSKKLEVLRLTGLARPAPAVDRLEAAGLLTFEDDSITTGQGGGRLHPFPRRMVRHLARHGTRATIATAFGHLMRCLTYNDGSRHAGVCRTGGVCKASELAKAFRIDVRRVKAARGVLVRLGWLVPQARSQRALNRDGGAYTVNLRWSSLPPPAAPGRTEMPPPLQSQEPLRGPENQEPGKPGVSIYDVLPGDLTDTGRTLALHDQAAAEGLVSRSEAGELRVVAAAEHARAKATRNAPGLFVRLLRRGLWHFLTAKDEDAARRRIRAHRFPAIATTAPPAPAAPRTAPRAPAALTDAEFVAVVRAEARKAGWRGDAFAFGRRIDPSWTRERWDAAQGSGPDGLPPPGTARP